MTDLAQWFIGLNPNANGLQSNGLTATYRFVIKNDPDDPCYQKYRFPYTTGCCPSINIIIYQYLDPIVNTDMNGTNTRVMENGQGAGAQAIQCYPNDPTADDEAGVDWFNSTIGL